MGIEDVHVHLDTVRQGLLEVPYLGFARSLEACEVVNAAVENYVDRAGKMLIELDGTLPSRLLDVIAVKVRADDALVMLSELNDDDRLRDVTGALVAMAESAEKARVVGAGIGSQFAEAVTLLGNAMQMFNEIGMSLSAASEHSMASADARKAALQAIDDYQSII